MKTSYLPAEAPLFLWDTFLFHPDGSVQIIKVHFKLKKIIPPTLTSSSNKGVLLASAIFLDLCGGLGEDLAGLTMVEVDGVWEIVETVVEIRFPGAAIS